MRAVRDGDQGFVLVYEPEAKLGVRELVFESEGSRVTVSQFPQNWRQLAEADLLALRLAGHGG